MLRNSSTPVAQPVAENTDENDEVSVNHSVASS
jgi:hypothetical protein